MHVCVPPWPNIILFSLCSKSLIHRFYLLGLYISVNSIRLSLESNNPSSFYFS